MKLSQRKKGFTLIELLIVIGLLGALTALVLPSMTANREEALGDVCNYSQAGTVTTLKKFRSIMGHYPTAFHTALTDSAAKTSVNGTTTGTNPVSGIMPGLPAAQNNKLGAGAADASIKLTELQAKSLKAAGITEICYGAGRNAVTVAKDLKVVTVLPAWKDDGDDEYTFDGIPVYSATEKSWTSKSDASTAVADKNAHKKIKKGTVVVLWVAPTIDWEARPNNSNNDWSKGNVELKIDLEGKCPIPAQSIDGSDVAFNYYLAFFLVDDAGNEPAELLGTSCPEDGIFNK